MAFRQTAPIKKLGKKKPADKGWLLQIMEASTRFELVMELLQSSALPLGDEAGMSLFGVRIEVPNRVSAVKR